MCWQYGVKRFHRDQGGSFSISGLPILLFLTIMTVCLLNTGVSLCDRAGLQRKADSAALCMAIHKARYLNAIVAHQHCTGELLSLIIAHHALGGDLLDEDQAADTRRDDSRLRSAYRLARALGYPCPAYPNVSSPVLAGEALLESHMNLKGLLTTDYYLMVTAWVLKRIPFTRAIGVVLERLALLVERQIHAEWRVLDVVRRTARGLTPIKKHMQNVLLVSKQQLNGMILEFPFSQRRLADELERRFELKFHVLPSDRWLPLKEDPWARVSSPPATWQSPDAGASGASPSVLREQIVKVTQLSRATFPWVAYHRQPLVSKLGFVTPLSGMGQKYFNHTVQVSQKFLNELQLQGQVSLYVLSDYDGPDKGLEPWVDRSGANRADKSFGVTVLAGASARKPVGESLFERSTHAQRYRVATAMVWNRHAPSPPAQRIDLYQSQIVPTLQAQTGWDTLNWSAGQQLPEFVETSTPHNFPGIKLGWEANLSPTTPARWEQLQIQPLPTWAQRLRDVLPNQVDKQFVGL